MLNLGTAKVDITPTKSVPLAGFASRSEKGAFEGISHSLYARVLFFRFCKRRGPTTSAVLVSADLIWWGSDRAPVLRERIRTLWKVDEVILHGTHTHSGPQTCALFSALIGKVDMDYVLDLESRLLEGIVEAAGNMEVVTVQRGRGKCDIALNRRVLRGDRCIMGPNPNGPVDPELTVIRFTAAGKQDKAIIVHYSCHPVTTADNLVSSEFTGVAMESLEQSLGKRSVAVYLQGTCGDIVPSEGGQFYNGSNVEVCRLGNRLADDVRTVLKSPMKKLNEAAIESQTIYINLPLQILPSLEELESLRAKPGVVGEWSRFLLQSPERLKNTTMLEITKLTLAKGLTLIAMNGEVVVEYGLFLKKISNGQVLPIGYCNGMIGYIPTDRQLTEGGYESIDSTYYFFMPAPYKPEIEDQIKKFLKIMVKPS